MKIIPGRDETNEGPITVAVCVNKRLGTVAQSCGGSGSQAIADNLEAGIAARGLNAEIERIICFGLCSHGPVVRFIPGGTWFTGVNAEDSDEILALLG